MASYVQPLLSRIGAHGCHAPFGNSIGCAKKKLAWLCVDDRNRTIVINSTIELSRDFNVLIAFIFCVPRKKVPIIIRVAKNKKHNLFLVVSQICALIWWQARGNSNA